MELENTVLQRVLGPLKNDKAGAVQRNIYSQRNRGNGMEAQCKIMFRGTEDKGGMDDALRL